MGARVSTLKAVFTAETGQAEAGFRRMKAETQSFGQVGGQIFDGMGVSLQQFAGAAGLGAVAVAIGKTAIDLERMREESAQMEARFVGFTGGTRQAEAAMRAFDTALGNAMTNDQKMATAAQLMGLGIAGTAEEAATLTRQAMVLGIGIDELSQALESGRVNGLIKYGIAASDLKKKTQELQAANSSLTATEATAIAVKEALAEQSRKIEQNGGEAATAITELGNAWEDLKDAAADKVNLEVAIKGGTETLNLITAILRGPAPDAAQAVEESSRDSEVQNAKRTLEEAMQARADYYQQLERMRKQAEANGSVLPEGFDSDLAIFDERVAKAQETLNALNIELALAKARGDESGSSMLRIGEAVEGALAKAAAAVGGVNAELADSQKYWDAWAGFAEAAGSRAAAAAMTAWAQARGGGGARSLDDWMARDQAAVNAAAAARGARGNQTYSYMDGYDPVTAFKGRQDERRRAAEEQQRENERLAKAAATDWQREMESATKEWQGSFRGAMDGAISDSIGLKSLLPGGDKGPNAPGANGFAEDIFRLQAFVNDGTWGETAQKHGLDKAGATEVIKKFQSGQWDESVLKVLDMDKLKEQIKQQKIAKGMMDQLAADLAAETQGDPKLIKAMLGLGSGGDGGKGSGGGSAGGAAAAGMDMSAFSASFLAGVDAEITKSKADYEKRGEQMWDALGGGFVKAAGKSAAFKAAVTALVDEAMADNLS